MFTNMKFNCGSWIVSINGKALYTVSDVHSAWTKAIATRGERLTLLIPVLTYNLLQRMKLVLMTVVASNAFAHGKTATQNGMTNKSGGHDGTSFARVGLKVGI